ncbi:hypothetical protein L3Q82_011024 [Scortum barcoo]|uniref:Uncharacterized protein n=1 Tax=Scortum barcoo TaxID=214431 RepID=A0ACB8W984_9TELE|nr:hypothetical protein L3Q82_011024 [Scortum barcoo]
MGSGAFAKGCSVSVRLYDRSRSLVRIAVTRQPGPSACTGAVCGLQPSVKVAAAGMRISTSKSEAMVLDRWKRVACPLRVGGEVLVLPQVEEFKYLGVLFTRVRERWSVRLTGGLVQHPSAVMWSVYRTVIVVKEEGAESKGEALDLPVNLHSHPHLWS